MSAMARLERDGAFSQVTRDHSLLQEQIDSGLITAEQAKTAAHKNLVTKALGIDPTVEPEIHEYETAVGDIYLLCSDGLCDMVSDEDISMTLSMLGGNLKLATQQLGNSSQLKKMKRDIARVRTIMREKAAK